MDNNEKEYMIMDGCNTPSDDYIPTYKEDLELIELSIRNGDKFDSNSRLYKLGKELGLLNY